MNETEWQGGADIAAMLDHPEGQLSDRKLRLFACACVRRYWGRLRYRVPRQAVEMAERLAEGQAEAAEVEEMRENAEMAGADAPEFDQPACMAAAATLAETASDAARNTCEMCRLQAVREAAYGAAPWENEAAINAEASAGECRAQANALREIVGNPFRPIQVPVSWLEIGNGAAGHIALEIDEFHRFGELPYLADALMDAGCDNVVLLDHLRQAEPHTRGCWALDLLLGRT
jgi:hypothetical protein